MQVLDHNKKMIPIILDEEGHAQFLEILEKLKRESLSIASSGSEEYKNAIGDGWHDNFAFEESMRESRSIASKIDKMMEEQKRIKVIKKKSLKENLINIGDVVKIEIIYGEDDREEEIIKLTGKYIPNTELKTKEISLNSPLGKTMFKKQIGMVTEYKVNGKIIKVKIIERIV